MENFVSAVLGDLVSRSVSFVVNTCYRQKGVEEYLSRLRGVLLQIQQGRLYNFEDPWESDKKGLVEVAYYIGCVCHGSRAELHVTVEWS
jgi:hypothetical protein